MFDTDAHNTDGHKGDAHKLDAHDGQPHKPDAPEPDAQKPDPHKSDAQKPEAHDFDAYARSSDSYRSFFGLGAVVPAPRERTCATAYNRLMWITGSYMKIETREAGPDEKDPPKPKIKRWTLDRWPGWTIGCVNVPKPIATSNLALWGNGRAAESIAKPWLTFDTIATRLGHVYRSSYVWTFAYGALAVLLALAGLFVHSPAWLASLLETVAVFIAGGAFILSRRFRVHDRWVIARDIEGQFRSGWNLALLGLGGRRATRHGAPPWQTWAIQGWTGYVGLPDIETTPDYLARLAAYLRETAVADQIDYHRKNADRLHLLHHTLETWGKRFFALTLLPGFLVLLHELHVLPEIEHTWLVAPSAGLPAIAAALAGLRYQGDFMRFATRSRRTADDLERVQTALDTFIKRMRNEAIALNEKRNAYVELRDIVLELDAVLVADLQDWRYVYSARPNPDP